MPELTEIAGRAWVIADRETILIADVDTDQIFHNSHLAVTDIMEMGQYAFGNLKGWEDFPSKVQKGDIVIVGRNFGCGSSRQQAVDCFRSLGVSAIVAISFGAIFRRNATNSGLPILMVPEMREECPVVNGDKVRINLVKGSLEDITRGIVILGTPASKVEMDIYEAGGLFAYGRRLGETGPG